MPWQAHHKCVLQYSKGPDVATMPSDRHIQPTVAVPCTDLQHAIKQVALSASEPTPVGNDEERQGLPVELLNGLSGLVSRVREPHLQ